jgi:hypothetical protein
MPFCWCRYANLLIWINDRFFPFFFKKTVPFFQTRYRDQSIPPPTPSINNMSIYTDSAPHQPQGFVPPHTLASFLLPAAPPSSKKSKKRGGGARSALRNISNNLQSINEGKCGLSFTSQVAGASPMKRLKLVNH